MVGQSVNVGLTQLIERSICHTPRDDERSKQIHTSGKECPQAPCEISGKPIPAYRLGHLQRYKEIIFVGVPCPEIA